MSAEPLDQALAEFSRAIRTILDVAAPASEGKPSRQIPSRDIGRPLTTATVSQAQATAAAIYKLRRLRDLIFGSASRAFGEPSWDMLVDLFLHDERGRAITMSSACIASAGPATTALRHIRRLEALGLVECRADEFDKRTRCVKLTAEGRNKMVEVLGREL